MKRIFLKKKFEKPSFLFLLIYKKIQLDSEEYFYDAQIRRVKKKIIWEIFLNKRKKEKNMMI